MLWRYENNHHRGEKKKGTYTGGTAEEDTTRIGTGTRTPCSELITRLHMYSCAYESDKRVSGELEETRCAKRGYRLRH